MDELLRKFWEVEEVPKSVKIFSDEEAETELHYQRNVSRLENGRYMVRLPLKENIKIGESKSSATKRLVSMERRFMQRPELGNEYKRFMDEFIALRHMEEHITEACEYFLPHHAVLKPESSTTKLRVVFDGSCKTNTGCSLNDKLLTGPIIQNDIFTIILNFRNSNNLSSAITLKENLTTVLSQAGFKLRKWSSNSREFVETIDPDDREFIKEATINISDTVKTLGLSWNTSTDCFIFSVNLEPQKGKITKRVALSIMASIFDPIGWIAPVIISMKIFMQSLWLHGADWDQELSENLQRKWMELYEDLGNICNLRIPRWMGLDVNMHAELHGFADSSESAYAAAIYLRIVRPDRSVITNLVASKTRVAPIKQISIPRLELCAAHLLVKLMNKIRDFLKIDTEDVSDSMIVLTWLSDHPRRWKNYYKAYVHY
ncbi:uncharacterized protein LOC119611923 [Lucilia sericata]|uniref:uncharacterized protein LOC119611923 n=1 Tax=Lucilia sericata TaxID=13632 RepID=UPI0018A83D06|nr:uncharacterized protein LOC119611923 [Lucilia sericata]